MAMRRKGVVSFCRRVSCVYQSNPPTTPVPAWFSSLRCEWWGFVKEGPAFQGDVPLVQYYEGGMIGGRFGRSGCGLEQWVSAERSSGAKETLSVLGWLVGGGMGQGFHFVGRLGIFLGVTDRGRCFRARMVPGGKGERQEGVFSDRLHRDRRNRRSLAGGEEAHPFLGFRGGLSRVRECHQIPVAGL